MVWLGRLRGHRDMRRVYGPDLMLDVCAWSEKNRLPAFFLRRRAGRGGRIARQIDKRDFRNCKSPDCYTPPFRPLNAGGGKTIAGKDPRRQPDILWVGLSTPKQEKFMAEFLPKLDVTLMIGVGAAFDFHSGRVRQAPRWMQRSGLEWFYRLCQEPRRLAEALSAQQSAVRAQNRRPALPG